VHADVLEPRSKHSEPMLRMSGPSIKLLLHRSRARLRELETAASPVGVGTPNIGAICHLSAAELRGLRQNLLHGLRLAAMTVWNLISDAIDVELMELLLVL